jgi:hypothetical protein
MTPGVPRESRRGRLAFGFRAPVGPRPHIASQTGLRIDRRNAEHRGRRRGDSWPRVLRYVAGHLGRNERAPERPRFRPRSWTRPVCVVAIVLPSRVGLRACGPRACWHARDPPRSRAGSRLLPVGPARSDVDGRTRRTSSRARPAAWRTRRTRPRTISGRSRRPWRRSTRRPTTYSSTCGRPSTRNSTRPSIDSATRWQTLTMSFAATFATSSRVAFATARSESACSSSVSFSRRPDP